MMLSRSPASSASPASLDGSSDAGDETPSTESDPSDAFQADDDDVGFGHPLQRMVHLETLDSRSEEFLGNHALYKMPISGTSSTSSQAYYVDFEAIVDEYCAQYTDTEPQDLVFVQPEPDESSPNIPSLIIRSVPTGSTELSILQYLNAEEVRRDPWNPAPRLLHVAQREDETVLCLERLFEYDQPPFQTIHDVVDYIRQTLEGLAFLHEQRVVHSAFGDPRGVMMDIGHSSTDKFDRSRYPVRYYRINFARAQRLPPDASLRGAAFQKDVQDCGKMLVRLFGDVPVISTKLRSLTNAMACGEFGAEDARKLFEALCKSFDSSTYETALPPS